MINFYQLQLVLVEDTSFIHANDNLMYGNDDLEKNQFKGVVQTKVTFYKVQKVTRAGRPDYFFTPCKCYPKLHTYLPIPLKKLKSSLCSLPRLWAISLIDNFIFYKLEKLKQ